MARGSLSEFYVGWEDLRPWGNFIYKVAVANQGK